MARTDISGQIAIFIRRQRHSYQRILPSNEVLHDAYARIDI
jgi:hypothetical protein